MELVFTMSMWFSIVAPCSVSWTMSPLPLLLLHTALKWFHFQFPHVSICWTLSIWGVRIIVTNGFAFCSIFLDFIVFMCLKLCNITVCNIWASKYIAHASACSLLTILVSFMAVSLEMIYIRMALPFRPGMNILIACLFSIIAFCHCYSAASYPFLCISPTLST